MVFLGHTLYASCIFYGVRWETQGPAHHRQNTLQLSYILGTNVVILKKQHAKEKDAI